jgi:fumarylacetoacetase
MATPRERPLLAYLREPGPMLYDIDLDIALAPHGQAETIIARTNSKELSYSAAQQLAHHASSSCAMNIGDLLGSGTISGPRRENRGSLLELSWGGAQPIALATGGTRTFLEDGDRVTLRGVAMGDGYSIGFGACAGTILPAVELPEWARQQED